MLHLDRRQVQTPVQPALHILQSLLEQPVFLPGLVCRDPPSLNGGGVKPTALSHPLAIFSAIFSAASIACSQVFKRSGTVVDATEKQNVRCFGDDGLHIIMHAAVVEFHPLVAIIRPAVCGVVAFVGTAIE